MKYKMNIVHIIFSLKQIFNLEDNLWTKKKKMFYPIKLLIDNLFLLFYDQ